MTLFAEETPTPRTVKCGACPKMLTDPVSIARKFGPCCAKRLGIVDLTSPRIRSHAGGDVPGQGDVFAGEA